MPRTTDRSTEQTTHDALNAIAAQVQTIRDGSHAPDCGLDAALRRAEGVERD